MIAKTALYQQHIALGAKMVDFHGWHMPLHYGSQLKEHQEVRHHAGLFDVSHMTVVDIIGPETYAFLRHLLTNDIAQLKHIGQALYSCMCNQNGGIIDDLIVYWCQQDHYRLVLNSATRDRDVPWINQHIQAYNAKMQERTDLGIIAIQGPEAFTKTLQILNPTQAKALATLNAFECIETDGLFIARTGYTGEDGLEIITSHANILLLWAALQSIGIQPCGLAARDTLRIEAGLLLYGQDMNETTTPCESGLNWTISWAPQDRDCIGMTTLRTQKQQGCHSKLVGIALEDKGIMRTGQRVIIAGQPDGIITSGTYSPSLSQSIGFARVPMATQNDVWVEIRDKQCKAQIKKLRFIPRCNRTE